MKKQKKYKRPINMQCHGDVRDFTQSGHIDTKSNLGALLNELTSKKVQPMRISKVNVLCSRLIGDPDNLVRVSVKKTYTFGFLLRLWERLYGEQFDPEIYKKNKTYQGETLDRLAWGVFQ
ncbi:MAG: hypothetical protein RL641_403 [Candidatus Parcubacteria bacterium]|jgi:hypothetical protein